MTRRVVEVFSAGCGLCADAVRSAREAVGGALTGCPVDPEELRSLLTDAPGPA